MLTLLFIGLVVFSFLLFLDKKQPKTRAEDLHSALDSTQPHPDQNLNPKTQTLRQNDIYIPNIVEKPKSKS